MFNNISNPKWFGDWSRLEDEYLDNNFTEIQDNFAFSKRKKTNGLFGAIVSLATAMMTMTISPPFHSQKPSKPERKETI